MFVELKIDLVYYPKFCKGLGIFLFGIGVNAEKALANTHKAWDKIYFPLPFAQKDPMFLGKRSDVFG